MAHFNKNLNYRFFADRKYDIPIFLRSLNSCTYSIGKDTLVVYPMDVIKNMDIFLPWKPSHVMYCAKCISFETHFIVLVCVSIYKCIHFQWVWIWANEGKTKVQWVRDATQAFEKIPWITKWYTHGCCDQIICRLWFLG